MQTLRDNTIVINLDGVRSGFGHVVDQAVSSMSHVIITRREFPILLFTPFDQKQSALIADTPGLPMISVREVQQDPSKAGRDIEALGGNAILARTVHANRPVSYIGRLSTIAPEEAESVYETRFDALAGLVPKKRRSRTKVS